jgi:hypothetical protein
MKTLILIECAIPVVVPVTLAVLKQCLPQVPKRWLPVLAPALGALAETIATQQVGTGTVLGAALGSAGVGLRELVDQMRKSMSEPAAGPATRSPESRPAPGPTLSWWWLLLLPFLAGGCKTPDETAYKTVASLEAAADHAMNAWADYVVWKRAVTPPDPVLAGQEDTVKRAYSAYRMAMSAAYAARATYLVDQANGLPSWQARLEAARVAAEELLKLVDTFLKPGA